jgi:hypothetical protein
VLALVVVAIVMLSLGLAGMKNWTTTRDELDDPGPRHSSPTTSSCGLVNTTCSASS